ncbi:hypothetical protein PUNSTDRAFT_131744 [Punctularia strigosozonata HHB-11173 SS5]|uniref:uncharacterized protein n=1 Tax=Punctularia strigosozonata (strain HHB-11173) TaxID=741275 RepID=UPI00044171D7|nr:uncharacterized protein PUNSTDRAFT_131744 [Punctularia strigosozonata HHB-11173 SS5]EIN11583.1 hypothetical protein PUNSTDRAFT_131744 [Punctularia strigosozonata HHB-11173 SS5]
MAETDYDLISSYAGLLSLAVTSIVAGSYGSIPASKHKKEGVTGGTEDDDDDEDITDRLSSEDAWLFPVFGSITLFGMYLVVKYLGKEWINWFLGWYFAITGVASVWKSSIALYRWTIGEERWKKYDRVRFLTTKGGKELLSISFRTPSFVLLPLSAIPSVLYSFPELVPSLLAAVHALAPTVFPDLSEQFSSTKDAKRSALLTDILALSFSHNALSLLKIDSFKTGTILLSGLFLYDIWWVFGTEVMVKVATNLDVPIKLLWPKSLVFSTERGFTMLGLGDIVIPGTFIALALRYDHHRASLSQAQSGGGYPKPYFNAALLAYVLGLGTTMTVMHVFRAAQPALLYLSPACILSFFITAFRTCQLKEAWAWHDEAPKPEKEGDLTKEQVEKKDQ